MAMAMPVKNRRSRCKRLAAVENPLTWREIAADTLVM
jgi:hypothetical protein